MISDIEDFTFKFAQVKTKLNSSQELSENELQILLIAHLMEEERNELKLKKA